MMHSHLKKKEKKKNKEKTSKKKKRQKIKRTQKHIYVQCRLWCKWHNRWKRMNFLRETINIVLYSFILSACFVVFFCKYGILKMLLLIIEKKKENNNNNIEWLPAMPFVTFVTFWIFWDTFHFVDGNWMKYRYYIIQKIYTCIHICLYVYT